MTYTVHGYNKSALVGEKGVNLCTWLWPDNFKKGPEKGHDMECIQTGLRIEVKADQYLFQLGASSMYPADYDCAFNGSKRSGNFFIERLGNVEEKRLGGPWKAKADGCTLYFYMFIYELVMWSIHNDDLFNFMKNFDRLPSLSVVMNRDRNNGQIYYSEGYIIPRWVLHEQGIRMVGPIAICPSMQTLEAILSPARM